MAAYLIAVVDVPVKYREPDKKGHADQVFHTFDILVVIDQREYFLHFPYR
jgi:hypothetical protein